MDEFFRFPHTPHLVWLGEGSPRGDKVLTLAECDALLSHHVMLEEKLDGANFGVSISSEGELRFQNRGEYLQRPYTGQFARLEAWLAVKAEALFDALQPNQIAFGEWCAARHTLQYQSLPDWWLVFDVYDRSAGRFWSARRRNAWAAEHGFSTVPTVELGRFGLRDLVRMLNMRQSAFNPGPLEGLVVRADSTEWNEDRAKLVRSDFVQGIGVHWRRRALEWNRLAIDR